MVVKDFTNVTVVLNNAKQTDVNVLRPNWSVTVDVMPNKWTQDFQNCTCFVLSDCFKWMCFKNCVLLIVVNDCKKS